MNSCRFEWIREASNTIRELIHTFAVPAAIAEDLQHGIATGVMQESDCIAVSDASAAMRSQVGF